MSAYESLTRAGIFAPREGRCDACGHTGGGLFMTDTGDCLCTDDAQCIARLEECGERAWTP